MAATATHKIQAPKGTRDFYPADMAVRRHIESAWRACSVDHGFDEIEGPTFEHLELYTVKSGPGIVSELFSFRRSGGDTDYALRPEFTPTLARMVAARAAQLPKPIRWFSIPIHYRAERPQRGRLREFVQWNADVLGDDSPAADADVIALSVAVLERLGLTPDAVRVRLSHREAVSRLLQRLGVDEPRLPEVFALLDRRDKIGADAFIEQAMQLGFTDKEVAAFDRVAGVEASLRDGWSAVEQRLAAAAEGVDVELTELAEACAALEATGLAEWCDVSMGIVRGLAYYTGTVVEIHEASGKERAIAGGGRYDQLVELFGGPPTPAVGLAMGDVVLRLVLEDRGLLPEPETLMPRPDAFVVNIRDEPPETHLRPLVARLRRAGLHARLSSKTTKNVGKLLSEAGKARARFAVILDAGLDEGVVQVKDLDAGEQSVIELGELEGKLKAES